MSGLVSTGPQSMEGQSGGDFALYILEALARTGYAPDPSTDYLAAAIAMEQGEDGGWHGGGFARTPLSDGDFSRTAMAIRALKVYGTPGSNGPNSGCSTQSQSLLRIWTCDWQALPRLA
jgi:hypothetical protein